VRSSPTRRLSDVPAALLLSRDAFGPLRGSGGALPSSLLLGNHRSSTKLRCVAEGTLPTAFDFGRGGMDELLATFKTGSLCLVPVATTAAAPRFHFKLMANRTQAGWANRVDTSMEFRFFDFAGKEMLKLVALAVEDILSPIMSPSSLSPSSSPRAPLSPSLQHRGTALPATPIAQDDSATDDEESSYDLGKTPPAGDDVCVLACRVSFLLLTDWLCANCEQTRAL
jgi:hypothetical protein